MLICQLTDLHIRLHGNTADHIVTTSMFTQRALHRIASLRYQPDVVVITGDLADNGLGAEYDNLATLLRHTLPLPLPTYVIPGNHDQRDNLRAALSHLPGIPGDNFFIRYIVEDYPVRLVMLDTLVAGASHGEQSDAQLHWLDETLAAQPSKPTMLAMHHPPFMTGIPHMDRIGLRNINAFRAVIARHRQVERIICGHHHRPIIGHCAQAVASVAPSVAQQIELTFDPADTGAFNFEPAAFHLHRWSKPDGFVTHTVYTGDYEGPYPFSPVEKPQEA